MRIFSWNIHGGLKVRALAELSYWKNSVQPHIMFILENHTSYSNCQKVLRAFEADNYFISWPC